MKYYTHSPNNRFFYGEQLTKRNTAMKTRIAEGLVLVIIILELMTLSTNVQADVYKCGTVYTDVPCGSKITLVESSKGFESFEGSPAIAEMLELANEEVRAARAAKLQRLTTAKAGFAEIEAADLAYRQKVALERLTAYLAARQF